MDIHQRSALASNQSYDQLVFVCCCLKTNSYACNCNSLLKLMRFTLAGLGTICYNVSFGHQTVGTMQGGITAPYNISEGKHGPDHLLVLVHGIFAR